MYPVISAHYVKCISRRKKTLLPLYSIQHSPHLFTPHCPLHSTSSTSRLPTTHHQPCLLIITHTLPSRSLFARSRHVTFV
jgi:hypothetical protein